MRILVIGGTGTTGREVVAAIEGEMSGEILRPGPSSGVPVQETAIELRKEASS